MNRMMMESPKKGYVVCTEERSGSNLLCTHLQSTGVMGKPFEILKYPRRVAEFRRMKCAAPHYIMSTTATPNGVYGFKIFSGHFDLISGTNWLEHLIMPQYVYLERRDLLGQAISLVKASQTKSFRSSVTPVTEPRYDFSAIDFALNKFAIAQARWRLFFATNDLHPLHLVYEDISEDPMAAVHLIANRLGMGTEHIAPSTSSMRIQRDDINNEWRQNYVKDAGDMRRIRHLGVSALRNSGGAFVRGLAGRFLPQGWYGPVDRSRK